jgi:1-aminocyclopropane-1-carboxylate deaminase/D-cysteine desulfhydrase-like pyridoxal-dependent ACC family enzyme
MIAIHTPTRLEEINLPILEEKGVALFIKRDDLTHPHIQGNKWRKLKYNIEKLKSEGLQQLLTFGGPVSNHIYATAAASKLFKFESIGVIRGYEHLPLTPTLLFAQQHGMKLVLLNKNEYEKRFDISFLEEKTGGLKNTLIVPDGGSNILAVRGVKEMIDEVQIPFDVCAVGVGTGGTLAGCILNKQNAKVIGFSSLIGEGSEEAVSSLIINSSTPAQWEINKDYQFGGYGKITDELLLFVRDFYQSTNILLDPIYTSKMMLGLLDMIKKDNFIRGSSIVAIHSGGLQAWSSSQKLNDFLTKQIFA